MDSYQNTYFRKKSDGSLTFATITIEKNNVPKNSAKNGFIIIYYNINKIMLSIDEKFNTNDEMQIIAINIIGNKSGNTFLPLCQK